MSTVCARIDSMFSGSPVDFIWLGATASPGFNPTDPLIYPSTEQQKKNAKHAISGGSAIGSGLSAGSYVGNASATEFFAGVDLTKLVWDVWTQGFILHSKMPQYLPSLFLTTTSLLGGRTVNGSPLVYSGFRAVRPDCASRLHYFADTIDPNVDDRVECPQCRSFYSAMAIPRYCDCGYSLATW